MIDAHAHLGTEGELRVRKRLGIPTMLCGTEPESAARVLDVASRSRLFVPCCALHPWRTAEHRPEDMLPFLDRCPVVGETGLDSVWCGVPMSMQIDAMLWHLDYAERTRKPVVLHTKGMEREVARMIRPYSIKKLVHWYSSDEPPTDFIEQDCYFTVGPHARSNAAVRQLIKCVPMDRLLTETDGLGAVAWALGREVSEDELPQVLGATVNEIAAIRRMEPDEVAHAIDSNYERLLTT